MVRGLDYFDYFSKASTFRTYVLVFLLFVTLLFLTGCSDPEVREVPVKLSFNVTDVFYKTIDGDPYAVLFFDLSTLDKQLSVEEVFENDIIYLKLFEKEGFAKPLSFTKERPISGMFVAGRVIFVYPNTLTVSYGFDTTRIPKLSLKEPNQIKTAKTLLYSNGTGIIESLVYN